MDTTNPPRPAPNLAPDIHGGASCISSRDICSTPNKVLTLEKCENQHGQFVRIVSRRRGKTNWVCIDSAEIEAVANELMDLITPLNATA